MGGRPILFLSYSGLLGGAERVLLDCATRLGRPAVVACPEGALAEAARAAGLEVVALAERPLRLRGGPAAALAHARGLAGLARDARALARREEPAAQVAWGARAVLAAAPVRRQPRARVVGEDLAGAPRRGHPPLLAVHHDLVSGGPVAAAVRAATRRADGVAAASEAVADGLPGPVFVMRPGVDLAAFAPAPLPPPDPPRALVLGALVPWKRADLALEVAARIPELQLTIAGAPLPADDPGFTEHLHARAEAPDLRGRVELTGAVADVPAALARAHCLLHCADAEPWGLALLEALAAGRPVVAPDAGGPREIVGDGAGRLYAPGDPDAAAAALRAVLADDGAPAAARRRAEAFSVEDSSARFAAWVETFAR
jgi:glycosyltransferase involved in cell wall biosynthesis